MTSCRLRRAGLGEVSLGQIRHKRTWPSYGTMSESRKDCAYNTDWPFKSSEEDATGFELGDLSTTETEPSQLPTLRNTEKENKKLYISKLYRKSNIEQMYNYLNILYRIFKKSFWVRGIKANFQHKNYAFCCYIQ